jgi:muramidase (phage lysozyme)
MALTRQDLAVAFAHPNVKAFYMVVRKGESRLDDFAYRMVNGGPAITDFSKHPYAGMSTRQGGRAAGAPQFIPSTWAELANKYGFLDFSPENQDLGYVGCLVKRDALEDVIAGRFDEAMQKCKLEWTSLPGAAENNPKWDLAKARALYEQYGGTYDTQPVTQPAAPIEERDLSGIPPRTETPQMPIAALIAAFGPMIAELIPTVAKFFDKTMETPAKIEAATKVIDTLVKATGAPNVQGALEVMQADPAVLTTARNAVITEPTIMGFLEVGGGINKAAERNLAIQNAERPFYYNPAFVVTVLFFPMMYLIVWVTLVGGAEGAPWWAGVGFDPQTRSGLINLVVGMVFGGVVGIWFGTSYGSMRKTEIAAEKV